MEFDKINGDVAFVESTHKYFNVKDPKKLFTSVTTLIGKYGQEFDASFWSAYKALQALNPEAFAAERQTLLKTKLFNWELLKLYNIDKNEFNSVRQDILDQWEANKNEACVRGTALHALIENSFYDSPTNIELSKFGLGGKFECRRGYTELDLNNGVYPEYLIHYSDNEDFNLAGQIDLLVKDGNEITIVDHKGLPLETPIPCEDKFKYMADIVVGDKVYDLDGNLCTVTNKSKVHFNPCYTMLFDNGEMQVSDFEHRWVVYYFTNPGLATSFKRAVHTTKQIAALKEEGCRVFIKNALPIKNKNTSIKKRYSAMLKDFRHLQYPSNHDFSFPLTNKQRLNLLKDMKGSNGKIRPTNYYQAQEYIKIIGASGKVCTLRGGYIEILDLMYREIVKVTPTETVPTQCITVDSPSHTYLCGYSFLVTHNSNAEIKLKSGYDSNLRSNIKMKYPLNRIMDSNYWHYTLQLSTYAWMLQQKNPDFVIKDLILNHYDHDMKNTLYHCDYLKEDVEAMIRDYKKSLILDKRRSKRAKIEY